MSQNSEMPLPANSTPTLITCSNCHSAMPSELRFCRNCGFRLGDGLSEYTETVRFGAGPVAPGAGSAPIPTKKRRKMSGMAWVFVGLLIFFIGAAAFTAVVSPVRRHVSVNNAPPVPRSYAGLRDLDETDQGVTFEYVYPPGGPADKAGLVGGDVILSFDGQRVHNEDELNRLMVRTPPGKTVDVEYMRDGETHKTKLTTISEEDSKRLNNEFEKRPEGRSQFGYDDDAVQRIPIPGTKMHGVQLGVILNSRPADMAGVRNGDIVIEMDGVPIRTPEEFLMRVRRAVPYSTVNLVVMRDGQKVEIPVKMGRQ